MDIDVKNNAETLCARAQLVIMMLRLTEITVTNRDISDQGNSSLLMHSKNQTLAPPKQRSFLIKLLIKLYADAKDWWPVKQVEYLCRLDSHLELEGIRQELGQDKKILVIISCNMHNFITCKVLNPQSFQPVFEYAPGYLLSYDIQDLLEDGFLWAMGGTKKRRHMASHVSKFLDIEAAIHDSSEESESSSNSDLGISDGLF
ncbi:hypothetical protein Hypma_012329, partial [Hypsizygus marmoreus]